MHLLGVTSLVPFFKDPEAAHAYARDTLARHEVGVATEVDRKKVTVVVEDQGAGFDFEYYLSQIGASRGFEEVKRRILNEGIRDGLGIRLMTKCADRIGYTERGRTLRLEKNP